MAVTASDRSREAIAAFFFSILKRSRKDGSWDVDGIVNLSGMNPMTRFPIKFGKVGKTFNCHNCVHLTSLEGSPTTVGGSFSCHNCSSLTSLEGASKTVGRGFECTYCSSLTTLEGSPKTVNLWFNCSFCRSLTSLEGALTMVGDWFDCRNACGGMKFTVDEVREHCDVKGNIHV